MRWFLLITILCAGLIGESYAQKPKTTTTRKRRKRRKARPKIIFTAPDTVIENTPIDLAVTVRSRYPVKYALFYYMNSQMTHYKRLKLSLTRKTKYTYYFGGQIPPEDVIVPQIFYYIRAIDVKKRRGYLYSRRKPGVIYVKKKKKPFPTYAVIGGIGSGVILGGAIIAVLIGGKKAAEKLEELPLPPSFPSAR